MFVIHGDKNATLLVHKLWMTGLHLEGGRLKRPMTARTRWSSVTSRMDSCASFIYASGETSQALLMHLWASTLREAHGHGEM